ncbi:hypothetical protein GRP75_14805, partial [Paenibacillus sp. OT2-17]|nr:hypothetical protein [Paenibacillus sp. OT2-17]
MTLIVLIYPELERKSVFMKKSSKKVVILGGGISGLSAAFYVKKLAE